MKTIRILVPKKDDKWTVSIGRSTGYKRKTAITAFNLVERKIRKLTGDLCLQLKEKWVLKVKYDQGYFNESLSSFEPHYILYCLLCFLEDYLSEDTYKNKEKFLLPVIKKSY